MAQFGRALRSGRRGRKFESCRNDWLKALKTLGLWDLPSVFFVSEKSGGSTKFQQDLGICLLWGNFIDRLAVSGMLCWMAVYFLLKYPGVYGIIYEHSI